MASVELTKDDIDLVLEILEAAHRDLREEIYKTEEHHFKERLKEREAHLEALLGKFSSAAKSAG